MASVGMLGLVMPRSGFALDASWASTLRLAPGIATSTIHNPFRQTFSLADTSRAASKKDSLLDLRPLGGTFGCLACFLGKLDLGPLLLAQLESVEPSADAREAASGAIVLRWVLLPESPDIFLIGSSDLYSRIGLDRFEVNQREALRTVFDSRSAILGQLRRLHTFAATNFPFLDFVYGLLWLLPFFTQFCVSGASAFDTFATTKFTWTAPFSLKASDAWLVGWFLSLPVQARNLLNNQTFAQALDGDCKRVVEVVLRKIIKVDRCFNEGLLSAIQSNFRQPMARVAEADNTTLGAASLSNELLSDFITASGRFIAQCEQTTPVCAVQAQRVLFHGTPALTQRLRLGLSTVEAGFWISDYFCSALLGGTEGEQHFAGGAFLVGMRDGTARAASAAASSEAIALGQIASSEAADPIESASPEATTSAVLLQGNEAIPIVLRGGNIILRGGFTPPVEPDLVFFGSGAGAVDFMEEDS
jgi:hypothetical protein